MVLPCFLTTIRIIKHHRAQCGRELFHANGKMKLLDDQLMKMVAMCSGEYSKFQQKKRCVRQSCCQLSPRLKSKDCVPAKK